MKRWDWKDTASAPEGVPVMTKIDDCNGSRNEQVLVRRGKLWFTSTDRNAMYVYYKPTHWAPCAAKEEPA